MREGHLPFTLQNAYDQRLAVADLPRAHRLNGQWLDEVSLHTLDINFIRKAHILRSPRVTHTTTFTIQDQPSCQRTSQTYIVGCMPPRPAPLGVAANKSDQSFSTTTDNKNTSPLRTALTLDCPFNHSSTP
jgi:hypothetical protein